MNYLNLKSKRERDGENETRQVEGSLEAGVARSSAGQRGHGLGQEAVPASD